MSKLVVIILIDAKESKNTPTQVPTTKETVQTSQFATTGPTANTSPAKQIKNTVEVNPGDVKLVLEKGAQKK